MNSLVASIASSKLSNSLTSTVTTESSRRMNGRCTVTVVPGLMSELQLDALCSFLPAAELER